MGPQKREKIIPKSVLNDVTTRFCFDKSNLGLSLQQSHRCSDTKATNGDTECFPKLWQHFLCPLAVPFARRCFSTRFRTDSGKASGIHTMARLTNCTLPGARPCCLFCFSIQLRNMTNTRKRPALNKSWRCLRDGGSSNISTTLSKEAKVRFFTWTINCCFASALPAASSRGLWRICKYKAASEASCWLSSKINREQLQQGGNATSLSLSSPWMPGLQEDNDRFCLCRAFFKHRRISCSSLMRSDLKVSSRQIHSWRSKMLWHFRFQN